MEVMHERVAGLDVHKAMIVACMLRRQESQARVPDLRDLDGQPSGVAGLVGGLEFDPRGDGGDRGLLEASLDILSDGTFELIVADAAHIKNVPGRKTDVNDATWIGDL